MFKAYLMYDSVSNTKRDTLKVSKYLSNCQVIFNVFFFFRKSTKNDCKEREGNIPLGQIPRLLRKQVDSLSFKPYMLVIYLTSHSRCLLLYADLIYHIQMNYFCFL